jgi:hypothetical protein
MTPDDVRAELGSIGSRLAAADAARLAAMDDLRRLLPQARDVLPIKHVAEMVGLTRPTIYKLLDSGPTAQDSTST